VRTGELRLVLGTDAASEGLNLQRLGTLINLDLPWSPTRLEQRKGRIQRIGQIRDEVLLYNMRYRGSVEDRAHELLSERLKDFFELFEQVPDILEDAWGDIALGDEQKAQRKIRSIPNVIHLMNAIARLLILIRIVVVRCWMRGIVARC
jgi:superfamily II DNA/RNA helicase